MKVPGYESYKEQKYQIAKVPPMEFLLLGAKVRENESSKFVLPTAAKEAV